MTDPIKHPNKVSGRRFFSPPNTEPERGREEGGEEGEICTIYNFFTFTLFKTCNDVYQRFEYMDYL